MLSYTACSCGVAKGLVTIAGLSSNYCHGHQPFFPVCSSRSNYCLVRCTVVMHLSCSEVNGECAGWQSLKSLSVHGQYCSHCSILQYNRPNFSVVFSRFAVHSSVCIMILSLSPLLWQKSRVNRMSCKGITGPPQSDALKSVRRCTELASRLVLVWEYSDKA